MVWIRSASVIFLLLFGFHSWAQSASERILLCESKFFPRDNSNLPTPEDPHFRFEVYQNEDFLDSGYSWRIRGTGFLDVDFETNGPIYRDGTTVNEYGVGGVYFVSGFNSEVRIRRDHQGDLVGRIDYFEEENGSFYIVTLRILGCERTNVAINLYEADRHNAKDETVREAMHIAEPLIQGVGVKISGTLQAHGLEVYLKDQEEQEAFVAEFIRQGRIRLEGGSYVYLYNRRGVPTGTVTVEVPMSLVITGIIRPGG